jgi:tetratricopeptide (TPR) repeat protein
MHELRGDAGRAIKDAGVAIRLDPNDAFAYNVRGRAYLDQRQYDRAIADYVQALRLDPALPEARENRDRAGGARRCAAVRGGSPDERKRNPGRYPTHRPPGFSAAKPRLQAPPLRPLNKSVIAPVANLDWAALTNY